MRKTLFLAIMLSAIVACNSDDDSQTPSNQNMTYDESSDGDLSNDNTSPTAITFVIGNNKIVSSQSSSDVDYFTFTVPAGAVLSQVVVDSYTSDDSAAFIGISKGASFPVDANDRDASNLFGGTLYGTAAVNSNILSDMGMLQGAQGFTGTLPAGAYTIWLNQTGAVSNASLNFIITTP